MMETGLSNSGDHTQSSGPGGAPETGMSWVQIQPEETSEPVITGSQKPLGLKSARKSFDGRIMPVDTKTRGE